MTMVMMRRMKKIKFNSWQVCPLDFGYQIFFFLMNN
ncbi:hypothetical protein LINPERPRIM_LOCUS11178 [Linum perenne]